MYYTPCRVPLKRNYAEQQKHIGETATVPILNALCQLSLTSDLLYCLLPRVQEIHSSSYHTDGASEFFCYLRARSFVT